MRRDVPEALFFNYPQDGGYKSLTNVSNYLPEKKTSYHRGSELTSKALRRLQFRVALLNSENGALNQYTATTEQPNINFLQFYTFKFYQLNKSFCVDSDHMVISW